MIHYTRQGQRIGRLQDDLKFVKTITNDRQFCRKYQGYGIDKKVFDDAMERGCKSFHFYTPTSHFTMTRNDTVEFTQVDTLGEDDGEQVFFPLSYMEEVL